MTKRRRTRRALVNSIISLIICFSMLIGTTFAWFTDSVTSTNNIIKAGNLDVELYWSTDCESWTAVGENTNIFKKNALWEPGYTEVVYLKTANAGTLNLKYQLGVNVASETGSTNMAGEAFKLSDYIQYGIITPVSAAYDDREDAKADLTSSTKLNQAYNSGTLALAPGKDNVVALVVYMPSTVDNVANHAADAKAPVINLGLNVYATQVEAEEDSFGEDYDKDAWADAMQVMDADDFQAAINAGETTIMLMSDIDTDKAIIAIPEGTSLALNLNGKKLTSNLAVEKGAKAEISNGTIVSSNNDNSAIETVGDLTLNDVTVESTRHGVRVEGGTTVINGGYYKAAGYKGRTQHALNVSDGGKVIVNDGTFVGPAGTASDSGSAVNVQAGSEVTINGGNFSGGKKKTLAANGTLIVKGGTFDQNPINYVANGYKVVGTKAPYTVLKGDVVANDNAGLNEALTNGNDDIALGAGDYNLPATSGDVTISGTKDTVITINKPTAENVTLSGVTVVGSGNYTGIQHSSKVVYEDCVIKGVQFLYAENVEFKNCMIDLTEKADYIWTYGAKNVTFDNCTFNTKGKAILVYSESTDLVTNVTVKNCTFNATESALASGATAAAIEIDSSLSTGGHYTLNTENNTVDSDFAGEWRIKKSGTNNTTVNGTVYNAIVIDGVQM